LRKGVSNKQSGDDFVSKKLDRVMANCAWIQLYGNSSVEFLERGVSDHSPALVSMAAYVSYGPKIFVQSIRTFWIGLRKAGKLMWKAIPCTSCMLSLNL
jgi:hypothetical protein